MENEDLKQYLYIPPELQAVIKSHISEAISEAVETYLSASEDEDALTGHLGAKLQTPMRSYIVHDPEGSGLWKWKLDYYKFRGRGRGATESYVGADGIFEMQIKRAGTEFNGGRKAALFQSKMPRSDTKRLVQQTARLSNWREAAFILSFGETEFRGLTIDEALAARGKIASIGRPLATFLTEMFINCKIGDSDLEYFARERVLRWRDQSGGLVAVEFPVKHRIQLSLTPPRRRDSPFWNSKKIDPHDIHRHRMDANSQDLLSDLGARSKVSSPSRPKALMRAYHPDFWLSADKEVREILEVRMKEFNASWDDFIEENDD
ncbi:MAG: hypothetical protein AAGM67_03325 [Bacteroidota bacterium]